MRDLESIIRGKTLFRQKLTTTEEYQLCMKESNSIKSPPSLSDKKNGDNDWHMVQ